MLLSITNFNFLQPAKQARGNGEHGNREELARATSASRLSQHCIPYITQASTTQAKFLFPILRILEKIEPCALFATSLNPSLTLEF